MDGRCSLPGTMTRADPKYFVDFLAAFDFRRLGWTGVRAALAGRGIVSCTNNGWVRIAWQLGLRTIEASTVVVSDDMYSIASAMA
jgi:hypothetical protein